MCAPTNWLICNQIKWDFNSVWVNFSLNSRIQYQIIQFFVIRKQLNAFPLSFSNIVKWLSIFKRFENDGKRDKTDNRSLHLTMAININNQNIISFYWFFIFEFNERLRIWHPRYLRYWSFISRLWPIWRSFLKKVREKDPNYFRILSQIINTLSGILTHIGNVPIRANNSIHWYWPKRLWTDQNVCRTSDWNLMAYDFYTIFDMMVKTIIYQIIAHQFLWEYESKQWLHATSSVYNQSHTKCTIQCI